MARALRDARPRHNATQQKQQLRHTATTETQPRNYPKREEDQHTAGHSVQLIPPHHTGTDLFCLPDSTPLLLQQQSYRRSSVELTLWGSSQERSTPPSPLLLLLSSSFSSSFLLLCFPPSCFPACKKLQPTLWCGRIFEIPYWRTTLFRRSTTASYIQPNSFP